MPASSTPHRLQSDARIAIVGAGLSGLSTAIALEQAGFVNVHVYEKQQQRRQKEGYGLTLHYHSAAVGKLRIRDALADEDCPSRSHYLFLADGRVRGYFGNAFTAERGWGQRGNLRVPREKVRNILIRRLSTCTVHWGHQFVGIKVGPVGDDEQQQTSSSNDASAVILSFRDLNEERHVVVKTDLVVAADGVRSAVVPSWIPNAPRPKPMGIRLILGLTQDFEHDIIREKGFYTLDNGMRLFVMPFSSPSPMEKEAPLRYMWQLSFKSDDDPRPPSEQLHAEALRLVAKWHSPVPQMIASTPVQSVWGAQLLDQDPVAIQSHLCNSKQQSHRVLVVGDALHAMSPFKGQGANQCLADGLAVASWLTRAKVSSAVKCCLREIVQRTAPVVKASREAALYWHSPAPLTHAHGFAGLNCASLDARLDEACIRADYPDLDKAIMKIALQYGMAKSQKTGRVGALDTSVKDMNVDDETNEDSRLRTEAWRAAANADRSKLRHISWRRPNFLRNMRDADRSSILHVAARSSDLKTVHWLVTEAGCDPDVCDSDGKKAFDVSMKTDIRTFLKSRYKT